LPTVPVVDQAELLEFIERRRLMGKRLMGKGLSFVDLHLLASALLAGVPLWTYDRKLADAARSLGVHPR
jgi:predicted nucleic acid-binding protein